MTKEEKLLLTARLCLSRGDARLVILSLIKEINKTGGERQRSEGLAKLANAHLYLIETCMVNWRDLKNNAV